MSGANKLHNKPSDQDIFVMIVQIIFINRPIKIFCYECANNLYKPSDQDILL